MGIIKCDSCNCCSPPGQPPCSPGCCKCPPTGDVCFDILDCQAYYLAENPVTLQDNWYPIGSCCTGMSFTLTHALGYSMCTEEEHAPGTPAEDGSTCLTTGTGPGMPTGTGTGELPELWGFSGTVCGDCTSGPPRSGLDPQPPWSGGWDGENWRQSGCDGMCLKASLCCCVDPFGDGPAGAGPRCGGGGDLPDRSSNCACGVTCYKFTMAPFRCHELDPSILCDPAVGLRHCGEKIMSACSPCSFLEGPSASAVYDLLPPECSYTGCDWGCEVSADTTGAGMGHWDVWDPCPPAIARGLEECGVIPYTGASPCSGTCPNSSGSSSFMVLVEGVYESQCDCALGVLDYMCGPTLPPAPPSLYDGSGVGFMKSVFVKFTALLSEC